MKKKFVWRSKFWVWEVKFWAKTLHILRCFFEKNFFFHERHKNFFPSKNYEDNISPNFLNTFCDPSNKFKANFEVLGLLKKIYEEVEILTWEVKFWDKTLHILRCFFEKKNFHERHKNCFSSKMMNTTSVKIF